MIRQESSWNPSANPCEDEGGTGHTVQLSAHHRTRHWGRINLAAHHGSQPPLQSNSQIWLCLICGISNVMTVSHCEKCQYPMGHRKLIPAGMWRCRCGAGNAYCFRFCCCIAIEHVATYSAAINQYWISQSR